jgi:flagellar biogenesis protein FliO
MADAYRQFFGVLLVLATLIVLLVWAKRRGFARWNGLRMAREEPMIRIVERVSLTPQHTLHVLAVGERRLLVTSSPGSCQLITELPPQPEDSLAHGSESR